jgi:predicted oxidoreductase
VAKLHNDDQIRRILHARQWGPDKLRTCKPAPLQNQAPGRSSRSRCSSSRARAWAACRPTCTAACSMARPAHAGLYCVGEAAGFGGGGASGKRSLEGTFLPGCILTARAAARSIRSGQGL